MKIKNRCKYLEHIGDDKIKCYLDGSIRSVGRGCKGKYSCRKYKPTLWQKFKELLGVS